MPEKVRRLRKKKKSSSYKRGLFFIALAILIGVVLFLIIKNLPKPDNNEALKIKDTKAAAVICYQTDCFSINRDGVALSAIPQPGGNLIFRIDDGTGRAKPKVGDRVIASDTLAEILYLKQKAQEEIGLFITRAVTGDPALNDFDLHTKDGWMVRVSIQANANATLTILELTIGELATSTVASLDYIDLRFPARVYYKTK